MSTTRVKRGELVERLTPYKTQKYIGYALEKLSDSDAEVISNDDIHSVWHYVSKSLDHEFSDDENHPMWAVELDLSQSYVRDC